MRRFSTTPMTLLALLAVGACCKGEAPAAAPGTPTGATAAAPEAPTAATAETKTAAVDEAAAAAQPVETKTTVAQPAGSEPDARADAATKAKLADVYKEIYCAQRRGESEKLLDIYTANGFDDPEAWTKVWTQAAKDGAWVAKTTHDAIRACRDQAPATP